MMTRKQKWRRVRCRPRQQPPMGKILGASEMAAVQVDSSKNKPGLVDSDSDEVSTISTWSSFDSVESALEGQQQRGGEDEDTDSRGEGGRDGGANGERKMADARRGVTFEPRVQVFLVTHKSELDHRAKQALWWTGRDAAINKRAWLNHLGQPGCGRQSVAGLSSPSRIFGTSDGGGGGGGGGLSRMGGSGAGSGAGLAATMTGFTADGTVGILGCRCQACLTEGDEYEYEYERPAPRQQQQRCEPGYTGVEMMVDGEDEDYSVMTASVSRRAARKSWPGPDDWERGEGALEEGGARSYSPASSSHGSGPLHDADVRGVFSASAYFWDRE